MKLTKTQKILLGTAITGVGGYFLYKYFFPTEEDVDTGGGGTGGGGTGTGLVVLPGNTGVVPLPVVVPPVITPPKPNKGIKVNIADLLATNINKANGSHLYSGYNYYPIYNMNNAQSFLSKKDEFLGIVRSVKNTSAGYYKITFIVGSGIEYYVNYFTSAPNRWYVKV